MSDWSERGCVGKLSTHTIQSGQCTAQHAAQRTVTPPLDSRRPCPAAVTQLHSICPRHKHIQSQAHVHTHHRNSFCFTKIPPLRFHRATLNTCATLRSMCMHRQVGPLRVGRLYFPAGIHLRQGHRFVGTVTIRNGHSPASGLKTGERIHQSGVGKPIGQKSTPARCSTAVTNRPPHSPYPTQPGTSKRPA